MSDKRTRTPIQEREERRIDVARLLSSSMLKHHSPQTLVAVSLGVSEARFRQWLDSSDTASIPFADVLALPPLVRRDLIAVAAKELGCELAEINEPTGPARIASLAKHAGDSLSCLASAIADGVVTRAEADDMEDAAVALSAQAQAIIALARKAKREGIARVDA